MVAVGDRGADLVVTSKNKVQERTCSACVEAGGVPGWRMGAKEWRECWGGRGCVENAVRDGWGRREDERLERVLLRPLFLIQIVLFIYFTLCDVDWLNPRNGWKEGQSVEEE